MAESTSKADEIPPGPSKEELEKALAETGVPELQEMGKRLAKSHEDMRETLVDLEAEQVSLRDENTYLRQTIELMMKEMQKLNIGASHTVEPMLEEGPLDFVGRFWEKVRPRDTAVVVSEHVGEIRKPTSGDPVSPGTQAQQIAQQLGGKIQELKLQERVSERSQQALERGKEAVEQGKQVWGNFRQSIGPLWQRAEGYIAGAGDGSSPATKPKSERKKKDKKAKADGATNGDAAPADAQAAEAAGADAVSEASPGPSASSSESTPLPAPTPAAAPAEDEAKATEQRAPGAEEQISSTILIEAQITIDDGTVQTLQVRAADRCKEVAARFVQEHSLKAWFVDPLTAWLKKVEADAEKFPVKLEADLMEIRKAHSKAR